MQTRLGVGADMVGRCRHEGLVFFEASQIITQSLVKVILESKSLQSFNSHDVNQTKDMKLTKEDMLRTKTVELSEKLRVEKKHYVEQSREKGASLWLSALPIASQSYILNKREFRDSICLSYGWKLDGVPSFCACGQNNDLDYALRCSRMGYVHLRHNHLRDIIGQLLVDAKCHDVVIEPPLMTVNPEGYKNSTNTQPEARLDIAATGVYSTFERTFFHVRVTHPSCYPHIQKTIPQLYREQEEGKKRFYEEWAIQSEKGSFIPLVFTTSGGYGPLCRGLVQKLARRIAEAKNELYEDLVYHLRVRIRYICTPKEHIFGS